MNHIENTVRLIAALQLLGTITYY